MVQVTGDRDAGYWSTSKMLAQAATFPRPRPAQGGENLVVLDAGDPL